MHVSLCVCVCMKGRERERKGECVCVCVCVCVCLRHCTFAFVLWLITYVKFDTVSLFLVWVEQLQLLFQDCSFCFHFRSFLEDCLGLSLCTFLAYIQSVIYLLNSLHRYLSLLLCVCVCVSLSPPSSSSGQALVVVVFVVVVFYPFLDCSMVPVEKFHTLRQQNSEPVPAVLAGVCCFQMILLEGNLLGVAWTACWLIHSVIARVVEQGC